MQQSNNAPRVVQNAAFSIDAARGVRRVAKRHLVRRKSQGAARHKVNRVLFREPLHDLARTLQSPGPGADVEGGEPSPGADVEGG